MLTRSWWQRLLQKIRQSPIRRKNASGSTRYLQVEVLETRMVPAFAVTSNITIHITGSVTSVAFTDPARFNDGAVSPLREIGTSNIFTAANLRSAVAGVADFGGNNTILLENTTSASNDYELESSFGGQLNIIFNNFSPSPVSLTIKNKNGGANISTITRDDTSSFRLFEVYGGGSTIFDHVKLTNGEAPSYSGLPAIGGAIFNHGNLTLQSSQVVNNAALGYSGAESAPTQAFGGAIYQSAGLVAGPLSHTTVITGTSLTIKNSLFIDNSAVGGSGNSTSVNGAGAAGGAIYIEGFSGPVTITGTTFGGSDDGNHAFGGSGFLSGNSSGGFAFGGAIALETDAMATLSIDKSKFIENGTTSGAGDNINGLNGSFSGSGSQGGAIYYGFVQGIYGGPIAHVAMTPAVALTISNTTFDQNAARGGDNASGIGAGAEGGAVELAGYNGTNITASTFSNNKAIGGDGDTGLSGGEGGNRGGFAYGGAVGIRNGSLINIVNSTLAFNAAYGGSDTTFDFSGSYGSGGAAYGGAIEINSYTNNYGTKVNLVNDTIAYNHVYGGEGISPDFEGSAYGGGVANLAYYDSEVDDAPVISTVNAIIAKNFFRGDPEFDPTGGSDDVYGDFYSLGHNLIGNDYSSFGFGFTGDLIGIDPGLDTTLKANGAIASAPKTLALLPTSKAINAGDNGVTTGTLADSTTMADLGLNNLTTDERGPGFPRRVGRNSSGVLTVDIGAYEFQLNLDYIRTFRSGNTPIKFIVSKANGLLKGAPKPPGGTYEVVPFITNFGPGTLLKVFADGSYEFTVPARYKNTVQFLFRLVFKPDIVHGPLSHGPLTHGEVELEGATNLYFQGTLIVNPGALGRGLAGAYGIFGQIPG